MSLISDILGKLFGKDRQKPEPKPVNHYLVQWEKERAERIKAAEERLKTWIIATVKEKGSLPFTWESGNDEAFVTFKDRTDADANNFEDLETYIIDKLDIPAAGEFQMNGSGDIYIDNNLVKAKYSSIMKALIDYDEETEQEIYAEEEEQDSADKVLFTI